MNEAGGAKYALGHSERELERLSAQARAFEPFTRQMLEAAGVSAGMRVLDVGSGSGDVAFVAAALVGGTGDVIGVDKAVAAVAAASERARAAGFDNVTFMTGDAAEMSFSQPFDAVIGRLVLMHQPDPVAMLRSLTRLLRAGGIVAFQEFDMGGARSHPRSPAYEQCLEWIRRALGRTGTDVQMGLKLHSAFVAAGLPSPSLSLDAGIWGGDNNPASALATEGVRSLLPVLGKLGIASEGEVGIDTLQQRIEAEIVEGGGVAISPSLIGAWTKLV